MKELQEAEPALKKLLEAKLTEPEGALTEPVSQMAELREEFLLQSVSLTRMCEDAEKEAKDLREKVKVVEEQSASEQAELRTAFLAQSVAMARSREEVQEQSANKLEEVRKG